MFTVDVHSDSIVLRDDKGEIVYLEGNAAIHSRQLSSEDWQRVSAPLCCGNVEDHNRPFQGAHVRCTTPGEHKHCVECLEQASDLDPRGCWKEESGLLPRFVACPLRLWYLL